MHHLTEPPNIVELKGDKHSVHLVMELCAGGELFNRIIARGHYTERAAASLLRTIVQIVHTCHSIGVIHRDRKPENFLLLSKDENAPLKATDFGLSVFYKQDLNLRQVSTTSLPTRPHPWVLVSFYMTVLNRGAKDLVKKMLTAQVLNHPWIKEDGEAPDVSLGNAVLNKLKNFRAMNKFKKVALWADADGNGTIVYEKFITATMHMNRMDREEHLYKAFQYFDKDSSGMVVSATMSK
ncbi:putative dihydropyrimidinase-like [Capsicum annuum]|nr:putative dihydropyrimidinase-like [Capsicum annuum]